METNHKMAERGKTPMNQRRHNCIRFFSPGGIHRGLECIPGKSKCPINSTIFPDRDKREEQKKGGGQMNTIWFDKKLHKGRLFGTLRRTVAGALTGAMLLPTVPTFAAGGQLGMQLHPIQDETYRPDIEIESNFVRDDFGFLTGYMELGLRVKTGTETFRYLAVTLEYDTQLYTPVDWSAEAEEIVIKNDLAGTTSYPYDYYTEQLPAQKDERINDIAARTGIPDTPADDVEIDAATKAQLSAEVKDGDRALLSFWAGAADNITDNEDNNADGVVYPNMTTIAVVRFKVNEDEMENFSIKKNKAGDGYDVYYNKNLVTNVVELQAEMNTFAGTTPAKWGESVSFATDENIFITEPDTELALEYRAGSVRLDPATGNADKVNGNLYNRRYYYLPGYDATKNVSTTLNLEDKTYTVSKPNYLNVMEPAVKLPSAVGDADRFSYLTNLIVNKTGSANPADDHEYVTFPVVSKRSFMADADILDTLTTIVYVDWDNTLLGTQIVPKQTDVRTLVSDHVAENFIYHDKDDTTYSALDLNNPLALVLPTDTDDSKAVAAIQSLERKDSYRGKYPYDGPQPDGTTTNTVTDGEDYPLTNKLDYVFCKRPMISQAELNKPNPKDAALYPLGVNDPAYIAALTQWENDCKANNWDNIWVQRTEETTPGDPTTAAPVYDVERPFAYGWAKCTADNFENTWTTLASTGELSSYVVAADGTGKVTYEPSIAGQPFEFADLEKGFAKDEGTVFLKAIYEPGTDLLDNGFLYRQIVQPYYNKLNYLNSEAGGAYSATMTYERASTEMPNDGGVLSVKGVQRMREPYVRQDTTADLRWEENSALGISHNLTNATDDESYINKNKTTYTKVDIGNGEEITFSLTLSGRQNKVDYYLVDGYGANFVSGDPRTTNDSNRDILTGEATLDNYNYYVEGQSDETDAWHDAPYADKEGSRGFVLTGTLNQIMEQATLCNNGAIDKTVFSRYASVEVLADINLRFANGDAPDFFTLEEMIDKILAAAAAAVGNPAYWNAQRDCAQLTYHQLQGFVMDGSLNHGEGPISGLTWCHLHTDCVNAVSDKPTDWPKLLEVARRTDPSPIEDLTASEMETNFHLRSSGAGAAFATVTDFKDAVVAAVTALDTAAGNTTTAWTWDDVQKAILANLDPTFTGTSYWWYDGSTSMSLSSWSDLLAAAKDAYTPVWVPSDDKDDNTTWSTREDKLNQLETAFNANASVAANATAAAWVQATENLCITVDGKEGQKFGSFADFKTALIGALTKAKDAGVTSPDWYQIQYAILNAGTVTAANFPVSYTAASGTLKDTYDSYWWHNGNQKVTDLVTMLAAAQKAVDGDTGSWDSFKFTDFCQFDTTGPTPVPINPQLHFRKGFNGTTDVYAEADFAAFKAAVLAFVQDPNVTIATAESTAAEVTASWNQLQYWLLHPGCDFSTLPVKQGLSRESKYYWWRNGADGEAYTLTPGTTDAQVKTLMEAAYRFVVNGNPKALDNLTADAATAYHLIPSYAGTEPDWDSLTKYDATTIDGLKTALTNLMKESAVTADNYESVAWRQIQHYILTGGTYLEVTDSNLPGDGVTDAYWWREGTTNPASGDVNTPMDDLTDAIDSYIKGDLGTGTAADNALKAYVDTLFGADKLAIYGGTSSAPKPPASLSTANKTTLKTKLVNLAKNLKGKQGVTGLDGAKTKDKVDWYVLQYYMLNTLTTSNPAAGAMKTPAEAKAWCDSKGLTPPSFVTGASVMSLRLPMMMAPSAPVVETTVSPDGLTETTKTTTKAWNAYTMSYDTTIVTVSRTRVTAGETTFTIVTTTKVVIAIDPETYEVITTSETTTETVEETEKSDPVYTNTPDTDIVELPGDTSDDTGADIVHPDIPEETPGNETDTSVDETDAPDAGEAEEEPGNGPDNVGGTSEGEDTDLPDVAPPLSDTPYVIEPDTDILPLSVGAARGRPLPSNLAFAGMRSNIRPRIKSNLATIQRLQRPTGEEGDPMTTKLYHMDDILALTVLPNRLLAFSSLWDSGGPPQWGPIILQHDAQGRAFL